MTHQVSRFDRFLHAVLWIMAIVLIPLALVVGVGRELLPLLLEQKQAVERMLHARTGLDLRIGDLQADWVGFTPHLEVRQLQILSPQGETLLVVPRVTTEPDWWASLRDLGPRLRTQVSGLSLTLVPTETGGVEVQELASLGHSDPERARNILRQLIAQPGVVLTDNVLRWQVPGKPARVLRDVEVQQYKTAHDYRLQVRFRLDESPSLQTALIMVQGDPLQLQSTPWQAWLQLDDLPAWQHWLAQLPLSFPCPDLRSGRLDAWLASPGGLPTSLTAVAHSLDMTVHWPARGDYVAEHLSGTVSLRHDGEAWHGAGDDLTGTVNGRPLPLQRVAVDYDPDNLVLAVARLSLKSLDAWLAAEHVLPAAADQWREQLQPDGILPRAWLQLQRNAKGGWALAAGSIEFKALALTAAGEIPGVQGLAGWLQFAPDHGLAWLDTRHAEVSLPRLFREPISVNVLRGGLRWLHQDGVMHIDTGSLTLTNADADGSAQLALRIPDGHPENTTLDLLAGLHSAQASSVWRYVPWTVANDHVLAWLKQALPEGEITQGAFMHSGLIHPGPQQGRLDMHFQLAKATLDYLPGWPALRNMDADVRIEGPHLTVSASRADIMAGQAHDLQADIPTLAHPILQVNAGLDLDLKDLDRLMAESPLRAQTGDVAQQLALSGPAQAKLGLRVALAGGEGPDVTVDGRVNRAQVGLPAQALTFDGVTGNIRFDSRMGLNAAGLQAGLWGRPVQVQLEGMTRAGRWWQQRIQLDTQMDFAALGRWQHMDLSRYVRGTTPMQVGLTLPVASHGSTDLRINSPLTGAQLLLPAPLTKAAADSLPLSYSGHLGAGDQLAQATLGNDVRAGIVWRDGHLQRLLLRLGIPGIAWPDQPGLYVEAHLPLLSPMVWQAMVNNAPAGGGADAPGLPPLRQVTLDADRIQLHDLTLGPTHAVLKAQDSGWDITLHGLQPQGQAWPVTDVSGALRHQQGLWQVSPLAVHQPDLTFNGVMSWRDQGRTQTQLKGQADIKDVGDLFVLLGKPAALTSDSGQFKADVRWPGLPQDVALANLAGTLSGTLKDGHIKEVSGVGLVTRLFGLINASNLLRRLKLDFSDVSKKGLNYDQVTLQGDVAQGVINPSQLELTGPTLSLKAKGWVNLNNHELDQQVRVGVPVSSAVPVVAGFLAGPVVGGALVAADLLLDKQLSKLTSVRYHVSGTWDSLKVDDEVIESLPGVKGADKPAADAPATESKP